MQRIVIEYEASDVGIEYINFSIDNYTYKVPCIGRDRYSLPTLIRDEERPDALNNLLTRAISQYRKYSGNFTGQLDLDIGETDENS